MAAGERWQLGDVIIWFETGARQHAKTDADVLLTFYAPDGRPLRWLKAYERNDLGGFEEGEVNCGYLGNLHRTGWLRDVLEHGTRLGIRIENATNTHPKWFVTAVSLDFRVGPTRDVSTLRTWSLDDWVCPGEPERLLDAQAEPAVGTGLFAEVGFDRELEIETGAPD
ncbi:MAG: hypothetical protein ACFHX7_22340 [Pseudomonadota bacterium]